MNTNDPTPNWTALEGCAGLQVYRKRSGASYRLRISHKGERLSLSINADSDTQAIAAAWKLRADLEDGRPVNGARLLDLLDDFEARAKVAPTTMQLYRGRIATFAGSLDEKPIAEIETTDVRQWLHELRELQKQDGKPYSQNSLHGIKTAVAAVFRFAARSGLLFENPFQGLDRDDAIPRQRNDVPRTITLETADRLAGAIEAPAVAAMIRFAVRSGLRSSELRAIRWEDVDLAGRTYKLERQVSFDGELVDRLKTARSGRVTPLLTPARDALIAWKLECGVDVGLIFPNGDGGPLHRDRLRTILERACNTIGIDPLGPHVLRHSFVAIMRATGIGQADLATLARDSIETVGRYYDANPDTAERADNVAIAAFAVSS